MEVPHGYQDFSYGNVDYTKFIQVRTPILKPFTGTLGGGQGPTFMIPTGRFTLTYRERTEADGDAEYVMAEEPPKKEATKADKRAAIEDRRDVRVWHGPGSEGQSQPTTDSHGRRFPLFPQSGGWLFS